MQNLNAEKLQNQTVIDRNFDDYTVASAQLYKNKKAWYSSPKVGDQIFFTNSSGGICHTGLVYKVDSKYVYTYEGNTSSSSGVIANGGCVAAKKYELSYSRIAGYGRPKYDYEEIKATEEKKTCPYNEPTKVVKNGQTGNSVRWVQWHLVKTGFMSAKNSKGKSNIDGDFGAITLAGVNTFQKKYPDCGTAGKPDGQIGKKSRRKLKELLM